MIGSVLIILLRDPKSFLRSISCKHFKYLTILSLLSSLCKSLKFMICPISRNSLKFSCFDLLDLMILQQSSSLMGLSLIRFQFRFGLFKNEFLAFILIFLWGSIEKFDRFSWLGAEKSLIFEIIVGENVKWLIIWRRKLNIKIKIKSDNKKNKNNISIYIYNIVH